MNDVRPSLEPPVELMAWLSSRPFGAERGVEHLEVPVELLLADVLGHADRRDGVEPLTAEQAVVLQPDLDPVGDAGLGDPLASERRLGLADGDADDGHVVVRGGVDGHRAPAAPDVEHPPAGVVVEPELAADQLVLGRLGVGEVRRRLDEAGARVRHRRARARAGRSRCRRRSGARWPRRRDAASGASPSGGPPRAAAAAAGRAGRACGRRAPRPGPPRARSACRRASSRGATSISRKRSPSTSRSPAT